MKEYSDVTRSTFLKHSQSQWLAYYQHVMKWSVDNHIFLKYVNRDLISKFV